MSKCVICKNKIGFFAKYFTVDTGEKVCKNCLSNSEPEILIENLSSAADVAFHMDNSVGDTYLSSIGEKSLSDSRRENEEANKKRLQQELDQKRHLEELAKNRKEATDKASRQEIFHFKVRGTTHYDLAKMVSYARKNDLFDPYDGYTDADIKEFSPYEEVYETDFVGLISAIEFRTDPNNKYDKNAIKVIATLDDGEYMLGHVPAGSTKDISEIMTKQNNGSIALKINYTLTGGKYKIAEEKEEEFDFDEDWDVEKEIQQEENETDFTKNLRIKSGKKEYGFNIQLFDNNIQ